MYKPQRPSNRPGICFSAETVVKDRNRAFFRQFDDRRWLYKNENEPRRILQDTTSKAELYALLAWHLYTSPSDEGYTSTSGTYFTFGEMFLNRFQKYICDNSLTS
jgi:hypothetical protein